MVSKKTKWIKMTAIIIGLLVVAVITFAKTKHVSKLSWGMHKTINQGNFNGKAVSGYDVVAFFTDGKASEGIETYTYEWNGAKWNFISQENLDTFKANPEKYQPQYGGYCAFAVSTGFTANPNPENWQLINGKLYLFASKDVMEKWLKNKDENIATCNSNWSK